MCSWGPSGMPIPISASASMSFPVPFQAAGRSTAPARTTGGRSPAKSGICLWAGPIGRLRIWRGCKRLPAADPVGLLFWFRQVFPPCSGVEVYSVLSYTSIQHRMLHANEKVSKTQGILRMCKVCLSRGAWRIDSGCARFASGSVSWMRNVSKREPRFSRNPKMSGRV